MHWKRVKEHAQFQLAAHVAFEQRLVEALCHLARGVGQNAVLLDPGRGSAHLVD